MEWSKPKKLTEMRSRLDHGHLLFIDEHDPKEKLVFESLNWHKAMVSDSNLFKIYVRVEGFETPGPKVYSSIQDMNNESKPLKIKINKTKTL